jgi:signal transduction histidine kinase
LLVVSDQGIGFIPEKSKDVLKRHHFGLSFVRERILAIGGDIKIDSELAKGAPIQIKIPNSKG